MADSVTSGGVYFPDPYGGMRPVIPLAFTSHSITQSTSQAGIAFCGNVYWDGKPASKVLSSAGGAVSFRTGAATVWTALSSLGIGLQDLTTVTGPPARPNLTFGVSRTITSSTVTLTSSFWHRFTMASGTKTITHGAGHAFMVRMGTRVSLDAATIAGISSQAGGGGANVMSLSASAIWAVSPAAVPNVLFEADDGTLGWFAGCPALSSISSQSISSGGANSEYGLRFVPPWNCQIDQLGIQVSPLNTTADYTVILYSAPNTTPVTLTAISALAEQHPSSVANQSFVQYNLAEVISLSASITYLLAVKPASVNPVTLQLAQFPSAAAKVTWNGGTSLATGARGGGAGAFSMVETNIPAGFTVRISQISPSTTTITTTTTTTITVGGGGGMLVHSGMTGGHRG